MAKEKNKVLRTVRLDYADNKFLKQFAGPGNVSNFVRNAVEAKIRRARKAQEKLALPGRDFSGESHGRSHTGQTG